MPAEAIGERLARWSIRTFAAAVVRRKLAVEVHGQEHLPVQGPTIVVARHYHHLYDAALLLVVVGRPVHFLVALDWVSTGGQKAIMEAACRAARWPVLLRSSGLHVAAASGPYLTGDALPYLRRALGRSNELLGGGRLLVVFPEGYPNVDPAYTAKSGPDDWLPFSPIFARIAARAERSLGRPVPVVPAGLAYEPGRRWRVRLRFGPATSLGAAGGLAALTRQVETAVVELSTPRRAGALDRGGDDRLAEHQRHSPRGAQGAVAGRAQEAAPTDPRTSR